MSSIVFFDPLCPHPYDTRTLLGAAIGGTEATVIRVADALGAFVVQHNRDDAYGSYRSPDRIPGIEHVVLIRDSKALPLVRELYPDARIYLWLHDQFRPGSKRGRRLASDSGLLRDLSVTVICVSDWQRRGVDATLRWIGVEDRVRSCRIYNPVDGEAGPDSASIDSRKLIFFSSPNKGLAFALDAFHGLRRRMPDLRLRVANPGYKISKFGAMDGVDDLGSLPHASILAEVRTALCTFSPNFVLPETFGLVYAESNAVGTPVLAHDCGAAAEVLDDPRQTLPVTGTHRGYEYFASALPPRWRRGAARAADQFGLFDAYAERIVAWRKGSRPRVGADPRFHLSVIVEQWRTLLA